MMKRLLLTLALLFSLTAAVSAQDLSDKSTDELVTMLENDNSEIAALQELGSRGEVSVEAMKEYADPYSEDKWTQELAGDMLNYFNSINWWEISGGDPDKVADICEELLMRFPSQSDETTGALLSAIKDKETVMEEDW